MMNGLKKIKKPCLNFLKTFFGWTGKMLLMVSLSGRFIRQAINSSTKTFSLAEMSVKSQNEIFGIPLAIASGLAALVVTYKNKKNGNTSFQAKLHSFYTGPSLLFLIDVLSPEYSDNMSFWFFILVFPAVSLLNYKFSSGATIVDTNSTYQCTLKLNKMQCSNENGLPLSDSKCRKIVESLACSLYSIYLTMGIFGLPISVLNKQLQGRSTELQQQESIVILVSFITLCLFSANMNRFPKTFYYLSAIANAGKSLALSYDGLSGIGHLFLFLAGYYDCGNENNDNCGDSNITTALTVVFILISLLMAILAFCQTGFDYDKNLQHKKDISEKINYYWEQVSGCFSYNCSRITAFCCSENSDESLPLTQNESKKSITINDSVNFQL